MSTTIDPDVLDEVRWDHQQIKAMFTEVEQETGDARHEAFETLVRKLVAHEAAEQELVHPLLEDAEDAETREERLTEERKTSQRLAELRTMGTDDSTFTSIFARLRSDVLNHSEMEEAEEHPEIRATVDADRLRRLARTFRAATSVPPAQHDRADRSFAA